ncbi:hypothetical protein [Anoxynatronum buryatiense]|uniref:Uncharacterized protein n=1 Tax=Anoxynatronum buryatiense TaxID=489973 RepID=A0AA45WXB3_9CLOT|nr:hypothetical protein [Anoxynatronum buryatiense]SMP61866.1 hypothetical protein SAMN06296020_109110 [Anoxynatronum buryatiense]
MAISLLIPLALLAIVVLVIAGARSGSHQGGEDMIRNVYIYVVLFATLMMTIGGSVAAFMAVADIVAPAPYYQSYEDYRRWGIERELKEDGEAVVQLSEEEIREKYDAMVIAETERQVVRAKNSLVKSLGWIAIPLPIFLFYSRKLRQRQTAGA